MTNKSDIPVVTIDGPSGTGKGSAAHALAIKLGWHYLDSGAIYRVLALACKEKGLEPDDIDAILKTAEDIKVDFINRDGKWRVELAGADVTAKLRAEEIGSMASKISVHKPVRAALLLVQRNFRQKPGLITDGRDMGTVVFPDAPVKVYMEASPQVRANRRYLQLKEKGISVNIDKIYKDLTERDRRDRERVASPTKPAEDAVVIDTTDLPESAVLKAVLKLINQQ